MNPVVTVAYAQSLCGRIATRSGASQWISGPETLALAQGLRRDNDVILVGSGTILRDNPRLTSRLPGSRSPVRVILDARLRTPVDSIVVSTAGSPRTVIMASGAHIDARGAAFRDAGAELVAIADGENGGVDLRAALAWLGREGFGSVYVEGGAAVITAFVRERLVRRMIVVTAPVIIGSGISAIGDIGTTSLEDALRPRSASMRMAGNDCVWELNFD